MNKQIFNQVHGLAEQLMAAAEKEDINTFHALYDQLESLCIEHDGGKKDHPLQWEALADFTEDYEEAVDIYEKAFQLAKAQRDFDFQASIQFSLARVFRELGKMPESKAASELSLEAAKKVDDEELIEEIQQWVAG